MKRLLILALFLLANLGANACELSYGVAVPKQEKKAFVKAWPNSELYQALTHGSGCHVRLLAFASEAALSHAVIAKKVDLAFMKDFPLYLALQKNPQIKPIAASLSFSLDGGEPSPYYTSYLLTLSGNGINTPEDLQGKSFGGKTRFSTSGSIMPQVFFEEKALKVTPKFYHSEKALLNALNDKKIDAIATWDWVVNKSDSKTIHILKSFPQLPNPPIIITHPMDETRLENIEAALYQIKISNKKEPIQGYTQVAPKMYEGLFNVFSRYCDSHPSDCHRKKKA